MVSIDTVYQRVLAIANKEQRGYITPLEFNLLANQAQMDVFEQYFYDLDQFKKQPTDTATMSDMVELIKNKLSPFTTVVGVTGGTTFPPNYRIGKIFVNGFAAKLVDQNEINNIINSPWHLEALSNDPIYRESINNTQDIQVYTNVGQVTVGVTCERISIPVQVEWAYNVIAEKALYDAGPSVDFTHHESDETELVMKVLELAGVTINKINLAQYADQEDLKKIQQEKS